jgi:hypothetical protein
MDRRGLIALLAVALMGCGDDSETDGSTGGGGPDPFDDYPPLDLTPGNARAFAGLSAPNMFGVGVTALVLPGLGDDPCPSETVSGSVTTYEGGCTTMDGRTVHGRATQTDNGTSDLIEYDGYGFTTVEMCGGVEVSNKLIYFGSMTADQNGSGGATFDLDMRLEFDGTDEDNCTSALGTALYQYAGSIAGSESATGGIDISEASTWNGSGRVAVSTLGKANVSTRDELIDNAVCETEAASGNTTVESGGDTAIVSYDGASDCDVESTAQWTLNGAAQGELTGLRCSFGAAPANGASWPALMFGIAFAAMWRRRSSPWLEPTA